MNASRLTQWEHQNRSLAGATLIEYRQVTAERSDEPDVLVWGAAPNQRCNLRDIFRLSLWPFVVETGSKWVLHLTGTRGAEQRYVLSDAEADRVRLALEQRIPAAPILVHADPGVVSDRAVEDIAV